MIKKRNHLRIFFCVSVTTSLKNETEVLRIVFCVSVTTSLKNETKVLRIVFASLRKPR
jgi:hypothetical protein